MYEPQIKKSSSKKCRFLDTGTNTSWRVPTTPPPLTRHCCVATIINNGF